MAPANRVLETKLRSAVEEIYANEELRDSLTVRLIRDKVEKDLNLDAGFFTTPEWKDKSKGIIKDWANKLIDEGDVLQASIEVQQEPVKKAKSPTKKSEAPIKQGTKRGSQGDKSEPKKRRKKEETPSEVSELSDEPSEASFDDESVASDFEDDSDVSEAPKPKRQSRLKSRTPGKGSKKKAAADDSEDDITEDSLDDEDEESDIASTPPKKLSTTKGARKDSSSKPKVRKSIVDADEESEDLPEMETTPIKIPVPKKATPKKTAPLQDDQEKAEAKANDSDSSEMSVVIDEPPKPKQKRRSKSEIASGVPKPSKAEKSKKESKAAKDLTPIEVEIKTLQSQLVKCGVRKIWGFELKQYGDDSKAKLAHLKSMLREIGMTGRFSNERAREIKEARELQADLEAVKEMEGKWGLNSGRRNRGQRKSFKESTDEEDEVDEGSGGEPKTKSRSVSEKPISKAEKAKQEFAFLGDDDESDSD